MNVVEALLWVFAWLAFAYFIVYGVCQIAFTLVAWKKLAAGRHAAAFSPLDEIYASPFTPPVSIILPAYNEEAGVVSSVRSLLDLRYPRHEVIVVNDGSTDGTIDQLDEAFELIPVRQALRTQIPTAPVRGAFVSRIHPNLWVLDKDNGGKADALNAGINASTHAHYCAIDADAVLEQDSLLRIIAPFVDDPDIVAAAGGIVRVANGAVIESGRLVDFRLPAGHIARFQILEYFRAFLMGRLAFDSLNAVLIISGAFGLFKRELVETVGGYAHNTVGEDAELVARLQGYLRKRGEPFRIKFIPDPVCWTEAPSDAQTLSRQRRRWQRGLGETLWRHRRQIFNPRAGAFGLFTLPYFLFFELLGAVIEVLGIPVVLIAWLTGALSVTFFVLFLAVSVLLAVIVSISALLLEEYAARRYERGPDMARLVVYAVVESLGYTQLTAYFRCRGFVDLLRRRRDWGVMTRRGLEQPAEARLPQAVPRDRPSSARPERRRALEQPAEARLPQAMFVRTVIVGSVVVAAALAVTAGVLRGQDDGEPEFTLPKVDGLTLPARVEGRSVEAATENGFVPRFWAGVNLGSTIPGRAPGEVAATRRDYDRWLSGIGDLGARVIRIYTILRPSFYDALAAYNREHAGRPLFFIQGVWVPDEEEFVASGDAYTPSVTDGFKAEIDDAVAVVHGDVELPQRRGHAGGTFRSDVSRWLLAYSIGIEWDGRAVRSTDRLNAGVEPYRGRYITAEADATPMESWLASMLDHTAAAEAARGWSRPLTFTNWLTLDPLEHPYEPLPREDLASLDATRIAATRAWPGGFFASYHAYPYYPDFMRLTPSYQTYRRPRDGKVDPYSGYLNALRAHHAEQAVMITEFGVPTSLGVAHLGPLGRDQGNHSEQEALRMNGDMLRDIEEEDYAGGIVFEWIDEWFKITWNTVEHELPADRRPLWRNDLTNEEFFGLVAADPGSEPAVILDGKDDEWDTNGSELISESDGPVREVRAVKDEQYLYLCLRLDRSESWREDPITIGLDTRPGGNRGLPDHPGVFPSADAALVIGRDDAQLFQAAWWEPTRLQYGPLGGGYIEGDRTDLEPDSGAWVHPMQILNRPYVVPATGERRPVEVHELGNLPIGSGDPSSPDFDSRTLVAAEGDVVEARLPWALLGYADPSSLMLLEVHPNGAATTLRGGRVGIAVLSEGSALLPTSGYAWDPWQSVAWNERKKAGFDDLASTMQELSAP